MKQIISLIITVAVVDNVDPPVSNVAKEEIDSFEILQQ